MPNVPLVLGEAVMILGADRRALSAAFLAARLEGESTFSRIAAAGSVALLGMGVAAATGVGVAVKAAAGLEAAVSGAGAVAYATTAQLAAMTKQSLELSQASTFSAAEIAASMEVIIKAGLSVEDTLNGAAQATVTLAQAGGVSLARAGDIVATSMQVWDLKTSDLTSTINEIAAAANVSRFDVEDLQRAVASGGTAARLAKIPFDDFMTTIAATAKSFNTGADAGVAFKTFVNRLLPTTKAAREEMQKLGIITKEGLNRFADAEGNIRPMVDIVNVLHESFGKLSTAQQIMSAKIIFGERAGRLAPTLARMTAEDFQQLDKYMKSLDANEIAAMRLDNAQSAAQRLLRTVQALSIEFGMGFLERIKRGAIVAQQELPKIVDALREGLTGKMPPARITVPSIEVLRTVTNQGEEGAARGMVGAGPSNMEVMAKRAGDVFRLNVLPRLKEFVDYINSQVVPALTNFAQHDVWPKLQTFGQIVGVILVESFRALNAVLSPTITFLSQHKDIIGALIVAYSAYVAVSAIHTTAIYAQQAALIAYRAAATGVLIVQGLLQGTMLISPWTLLGIAVVALAAGAVLLYKNWDAVARAFKDAAPLLELVAAGIGAVTAAIFGYMIIAKTAIVTTLLMNAALAATPIGLFILGVIGLTAALGLWANSQKQVTTDIQGTNIAQGELRNSINTTNPIIVKQKDFIHTWADAFVRLAINIGGTRRALSGLADDEARRKQLEAVAADADKVNRDEFGAPVRTSGVDEFGNAIPTEGGRDVSNDWRTAPPSNPNFLAKKGPPNIIPPGMKYDPELDSLVPDPDFALGDYTAPEGGWEMPPVDEKAKKKKDEEDRMKNAIDALNTRFFNDLADELFKNPNASLGPLIAKQGLIRAEIAKTAQTLMDTLGVDLPTAFEKASEEVLKRIDDMEKELEKGPKLSGWLGFLAAAFEENMAKFQVGIGSATAKRGDAYTVNGGINITPDPDVPGGIDIGKVDTAWKQAKLVKAYE